MKKTFTICALGIVLAVNANGHVCFASSSPNVAEGKPVTLQGTFFVYGWGGGTAGDPQSAVDGNFFPRSHQWDQGTLWWDAHYSGSANNSVLIDLGGIFRLDSFVVQADDNDAYLLEYKDGSGDWRTAYQIPVAGGWGMQTRPNPGNDAEQYFPGFPIETSALRLSGIGGDKYYSVSEIQAYGSPVPVPAALWMLGSGMAALASIRSRRKVA